MFSFNNAHLEHTLNDVQFEQIDKLTHNSRQKVVT